MTGIVLHTAVSSQRSRRLLALFQSLSLPLVLLAIINACGRPGEGDKDEKAGFDGDTSDVLGAITSQSGGQSDMQGWILVLMDRDTGLARVAEVDGAGLYRLKKVPVGSVYTLVLLSPDFIVTSVLSMPSPVQNTIRQFFQLKASTMPRIINQGDIIIFENVDKIAPTKDLAADADGDMIPDGSAGFGLTAGGMPQFALGDLDGDGTTDNLDADIDGDGVINRFDPDDDGDGVLDVVDLDSDGNLNADSQEQLTDVYYKQGVEWVAITYEKMPLTGTTDKTTLTFTTKLNAGFEPPISVNVRGSNSLLNSATVEYIDEETGEESSQAFIDRALFDDGLNEDGSPDDLVFARKITLGKGVKPRPNQAFFVQLAYGSTGDPWFVEFPYTLPNIKTKAIAARFDKSTKTVNLVGNPFNALQEYLWTVKIYNAEGLLVDTSTPILGSQSKTQVVKEHLVEAGDHTFRVVAQLLDRVPGYASFKVNTPLTPLK